MSRRAERRRRTRRISRRRLTRLTRDTGILGPPRQLEAEPGRLRKTNLRTRYWTDENIQIPASVLRDLVSMEEGEPGSPTGGRSRVRRRGR